MKKVITVTVRVDDIGSFANVDLKFGKLTIRNNMLVAKLSGLEFDSTLKLLRDQYIKQARALAAELVEGTDIIADVVTEELKVDSMNRVLFSETNHQIIKSYNSKGKATHDLK